MSNKHPFAGAFEIQGVIRRLLLSWLLVSAVQYTVLSFMDRSLLVPEHIAGLPFGITLLGIVAVFAGLSALAAFYSTGKAERWGLFFSFGLYAFCAIGDGYSLSFLVFCGIILAVLGVYALFGSNQSSEIPYKAKKSTFPWLELALVACGVVLFIYYVCQLTVYRVKTFSAPTYDFGIFSQMFHNMRTTGVPYTTCERDMLLSHFNVHVSPIYYLMLPFYALFPSPVTLQVLQAVVLASAVIPLWRIARRHSIPTFLCTGLCLLLLFYPAYAGGTSYDLHENAFLTPLLLWLFYFIEARNWKAMALSAILTLMVKEDAAVYVAVVALWLLASTLRAEPKERRGLLIAGGGLFLGALAYFIGVTTYLATKGDGVMAYRYGNYIYDGSQSLLAVVKTVFLSPMKAIYECADGEKTEFFLETMLPLLALPLFTRKYERYILLIPYILVNLMTDYQYQYNIFFQYTYGSAACLFYLTVVNMADLIGFAREHMPKAKNYAGVAVMVTALLISAVLFRGGIVSKAEYYSNTYYRNSTYYDTMARALKTIPDNASVAATTYLTVPLSQRETLYDVHYCSRDHLLEVDYVVVQSTDSYSLKNYATNEDKSNGLEELTALLESAGFTAEPLQDTTIIVFSRT